MSTITIDRVAVRQDLNQVSGYANLLTETIDRTEAVLRITPIGTAHRILRQHIADLKTMESQCINLYMQLSGIAV